MTSPFHVAHWCTRFHKGGAGIAAHRLFHALSQHGIQGTLLGLDEQAPEGVMWNGASEWESALIQTEVIAPGRPGRGPTRFSLPIHDQLAGCHLPTVDIHHLHWINDLLGIGDLTRLLTSGVPVVWTLHDQWPFTGGCHYQGDCQGSERDCGNCPQLAPSVRGWATRLHQAKQSAFHHQAPPVIICPTAWMATAAKKSSLLAEARVEVIPNAVDTEFYCPGDRQAERATFSIPPQARVLLFIADDFDEHRKGMDLLTEALANLQDLQNLMVMTIGGSQAQPWEPGARRLDLGRLQDQQTIRSAYRAADLVVVPSRQDNLPNIIVEASACGVPSLAFKTAGIPEMIDHGVSGWLIDRMSGKALSAGLRKALKAPDQLIHLGQAARELAVQRYSQQVIAERHMNLYRSLSHRGVTATAGTVVCWPSTELLHQAASRRLDRLEAELQVCQADRQARLEVIQRQHEDLRICEEDRGLRGDSIHRLTLELAVQSQAAAERLEQIHSLNAMVGHRDGQLADAFKGIETQAELNRMLQTTCIDLRLRVEELKSELENKNSALLVTEQARLDHHDKLQRLTQELHAASSKHQALQLIIDRLESAWTPLLNELDGAHDQVTMLLGENGKLKNEIVHHQDLETLLKKQLDTCERDRQARLEALLAADAEGRRLRTALEVSETDRAERLTVIQRQHEDLRICEEDRGLRGESIHRLTLDLAVQSQAAAERLEQIHSLNAMVEHRDGQLADAFKGIESQTELNRMLQTTCEDLRLRVEELSSEFENKTRALLATEQELLDHHDKIERLSEELHATSSKHQALQLIIDRLESAWTPLLHELDGARDQVTGLRRENDKLKNEIVHHQDLETLLKEQLDTCERDRQARLEALLAADAEGHRLRTALEVSETDRAERLTAIQGLDAARTELEQALFAQRSEHERTQMALAISEQDRADRLNVIQHLDAARAELENALSIERSELERAQRALSISEQDRTERLDIIQRLDARRIELEQALLLERSEHEHAQKTLAVSENDRAERLTVIRQLDAARIELEQALSAERSEHQLVRQALNVANFDRAELGKRIDHLEDHLRSEALRISDLTQERNALTTALQQRDEQIDLLIQQSWMKRRQFMHKETVVAERDLRIAEMETSRAQMSAELGAIARDRDGLKVRLDIAQQQIGALDRCLSDTQQNIADLEAKRASDQNALNRARQYFTHLNDINEQRIVGTVFRALVPPPPAI
jgi:glycosyltransferase involved in cell wall biosynthesis/chromosome segregation ATPase